MLSNQGRHGHVASSGHEWAQGLDPTTSWIPVAHGITGAPNLYNGFTMCKKGSQFKYYYSRFKVPLFFMVFFKKIIFPKISTSIFKIILYQIYYPIILVLNICMNR